MNPTQHQRRSFGRLLLVQEHAGRIEGLAVDGPNAVIWLHASCGGRRPGDDAQDLAGVGVQLGQPDAGDEQDRDQEVRSRSRHQDRDPLPGCLGVEAVGLIEVVGFHAAHAHVAEDREEPQGVKGAAAGEGHQPGSRADRELDHAHSEELGDEKVSGLVGRDQEQESSRDGDHADEQAHDFSVPELIFT